MEAHQEHQTPEEVAVAEIRQVSDPETRVHRAVKLIDDLEAIVAEVELDELRSLEQ